MLQDLECCHYFLKRCTPIPVGHVLSTGIV